MNFDAIAHDLKTPLTALLCTARLIGTENLSPDARHRLAIIEAQVERMALLIDSYLVGGTGTKEITEEHAAEILAEAFRELEPLLQRGGIAWHVLLDEGLPPCRCSHAVLHRVIVNVVKNAIDATPPGGTIACRVGSRGGNEVFIEISDTGAGMPANVLARAFERGFTTKATNEGHGLGLAISRELLRPQGGKIGISSQPDCGTRVTVTLPASSNSAGAPGAAAGE